MNVEKSIDAFINYCATERQLAENTLQAYSYDLNHFCKWLPSRARVESVTTETLRSYLEDMVGRHRLSPSTVRRRIACLRSFFRYLNEDKKLIDPFGGWRLRLPRRKRLPRALSRNEASMLLASPAQCDQPKSSRQATVLNTEISLMVATGIRVGELCKIRIGDVFPDGSALHIQGKGSRDRVVYVADPALRSNLRKLVLLRQKLFGTSGPLFVNRHGSNLRPQTFRSRLRTFAGEAGLQRRVTPHMLRHTAATLLIENGVDIRIVQRLLGHSSIATTEIYTHVSDEALKATLTRANILGALS
jgi:integrase/recombinase XerD